MAFNCVLHATQMCNDCMKCKTIVNDDGTVGRKRWQDLDPQKIMDTLARLLSEDKDYVIKITVTKKEDVKEDK